MLGLAALVVVAIVALLIWRPWETSKNDEIPAYVAPSAPTPAGPTTVPAVDVPKPQLPPDMTFAPPGETDATDTPVVSTPILTDPYPDYGDQPSLSGPALSAIGQRPTADRDDEVAPDAPDAPPVAGTHTPPTGFLAVAGRLPTDSYVRQLTIGEAVGGPYAAVDACRDICAADPNCNVYSYNRDDRRCWTAPTYRSDEIVNKTGWFTYGRPAEQTATVGGTYVAPIKSFGPARAGRYSEKAYSATYSKPLFGAEDGCRAMCDSDPKCTVYSYNTGNNNCWLANAPELSGLTNRGSKWVTAIVL